MKKTAALIIVSFLILSPVYASGEDGYSTRGPLVRAAGVEGRGILNLAGLLFEIPRTWAEETKLHSRLWPVTYVPRLLTNILIRGTSAIYDVFLKPWPALFTEDLSPLTEPMGLPEYPWKRS